MKILALNPGSTSTKIAYYVDGEIIEEMSIDYPVEELQDFKYVSDQLDYRRNHILSFLAEKKIDLTQLDTIVGRGGILPPVTAGAYEVNQPMLDYLTKKTKIDHPSNLGALLAYELKEQANKRTIAMIYDPVSVDEFDDVARVSGLKGVPRKSIGHALNMRAVAMKVAREAGIDYQNGNFIVAHLGGGNSVSIHSQGRMIDSISDDEGPFSTERTGGLPLKYVFDLCETHSKSEMLRLYKREGGLKSYAGTSDAREIEAEISAGNQELAIVYEAFIYQIAKAIGSLATVTDGKIDRIALTGGVSHSQKVASGVSKRVQFIAPVVIEAGEHEMIALSKGGERVVLGEEELQLFNY
ncbi:butyrate kinase [Enterococcus sp. AZ103]|uniref:butyrate kinase n=1 Tax=Enterococcus sp. AZ103 TaxID=2774628 RepID=UPI003F27EF2C